MKLDQDPVEAAAALLIHALQHPASTGATAPECKRAHRDFARIAGCSCCATETWRQDAERWLREDYQRHVRGAYAWPGPYKAPENEPAADVGKCLRNLP